MTNYKEPLVRLSGNRLITTSLAVSQHFGKKHQHVLEAIRNLDCSQDFNASNFRPITYTDGRGRQKPADEITRDGFSPPCLRHLFVHNAWRGLKTSGIAASAPVSCGFFMPVWATRYVGRAKNTIPARGIIPAVYFRLLSLPTPIAAKRGITSKK